jgi:hypothetical protein
MPETQPEAHRPPLPIFLYKVVNPTLALLLRSPLHRLLSGRLTLLTITGRKTGKRYRVPVGYVQVDTTVLINTQSRWQHNLAGGAEVTLRLRGQDRRGWAEILGDPEAITAAYRSMLATAPQLGAFIGIRCEPSGDPVQSDVQAARARGYVVVVVKLSA